MITDNEGVYSLRKGNGRIFLLGLMLIMGLGFFQVAAEAQTVGYVDFEFLFEVHPEYEMKNEDLQQAAEMLNAQFQQEARALENDSDVQILAAEYEAELERVAAELREFIVGSVRQVIQEFVENNDIGVVVPQDFVIAGGVDLTPLVLEAMYQTYGISVPSHLRDIF